MAGIGSDPVTLHQMFIQDELDDYMGLAPLPLDEDFPTRRPRNPVEWVVMEDFCFPLRGSGPTQFLRGRHITDKLLAADMEKSKAPIRVLR